MAKDYVQSPEVDLDKTDRLPILDGAQFDHDVEDDAVAMDHTATMLALPSSAAAGMPEFVRSSGVDLPSLAESVRSVEERIARQSADYEALSRAHEKSLEAESSQAKRADALAGDLAASRTSLESEQTRTRELDKLLVERTESVESARARIEESLRESERHQAEAGTLRNALVSRDATIAQVLHSLGERDAQLTALQTEHTRVLPELDATLKSSARLDTELQAVRVQVNGLGLELQASRETAAALAVQLQHGDAQANAVRTELKAVKSQASSYLEVLRTREWRRGFDHNMFRELDAQVGAANAGQGVLASERDRLQSQVAALEAKLVTQGQAIENLQAAAAANTATLAQQSNDLKRAEETRSRLATQLGTADTEVVRLNAQMAVRDEALAGALERGNIDAKKITELLQDAERRHAEHSTEMAQLRDERAAQVAQMQIDAEAREQEMSVLVAHLTEARRPLQLIEANVKRLSEELAAKSTAFQQLEEDSQKLRATLERTRGALEEREFLIRRLERSESNNANVLGRIQTSIERLGSVPHPGATGTPSAAAEWSAELIRVDGERAVTHVLSRRTRIGRAVGCEVQIDSSSVSRHHALILVGPRDSIIEDLNSTNGVLVNGRKVSRQSLNDGDAVTIGEIQFRYVARPQQRSADPAAGGAAPLE
jgi:chromosome segregation ATPase